MARHVLCGGNPVVVMDFAVLFNSDLTLGQSIKSVFNPLVDAVAFDLEEFCEVGNRNAHLGKFFVCTPDDRNGNLDDPLLEQGHVIN